MTCLYPNKLGQTSYRQGCRCERCRTAHVDGCLQSSRKRGVLPRAVYVARQKTEALLRRTPRTDARYVVSTLTGHKNDNAGEGRGGRYQPTLIYLVHDRDYCWRTVGVFDETAGTIWQRRRKAEQYAQALEAAS